MKVKCTGIRSVIKKCSKMYLELRSVINYKKLTCDPNIQIIYNIFLID